MALITSGLAQIHKDLKKTVVHQLFKHGHQRIVMIAHEERRKAGYGVFEQVFLEELRTQVLPAGSYNLPEWEDSPKGLDRCLEELFRLTPPPQPF